jgi:DeoR/GlpR family transcriptional regulator of sugar metabolism
VISAQERREEIVRLSTAAGGAQVAELARQFGVTPSTIRRDLALLGVQGRIARIYGGALGLVAHPEASLAERAVEAGAEKRAIARWVASQVGPGESILLDAGSTVAAAARELRSVRDLRVACVGLNSLDLLADVEGIEVHCLGGRVRPLSRSLVGPLTEASLERMTFDRVFLGADGVSAADGICEADLEQTRLKELMARRADSVYVLAHAAKLGSRPFHAWARLPMPWTLVTDGSATQEGTGEFTAAGVRVILAG